MKFLMLFFFSLAMPSVVSASDMSGYTTSQLAQIIDENSNLIAVVSPKNDGLRSKNIKRRYETCEINGLYLSRYETSRVYSNSYGSIMFDGLALKNPSFWQEVSNDTVRIRSWIRPNSIRNVKQVSCGGVFGVLVETFDDGAYSKFGDHGQWSFSTIFVGSVFGVKQSNISLVYEALKELERR